MQSSLITDLKQKLDLHYKYFDKSKISPDPLEFPHRFINELDIEISAFVSSIFAFGNIKQIMNALGKIHHEMNYQPYNFIMNLDPKYKSDVKHRFYNEKDVALLLHGLKRIYAEFGSLKNLFLMFYNREQSIKQSISNFSNHLISRFSPNKVPTHGFKFMFPDPVKNSACKRMNLFLRWMVRKDDLDFGLWNEIPASKLIIPVDTHIARICRQLKLTTHKNVSWKMAEEITESLKAFDPVDPVKYDFAICHIGMRKMKF